MPTGLAGAGRAPEPAVSVHIRLWPDDLADLLSNNPGELVAVLLAAAVLVGAVGALVRVVRTGRSD